jgi:2-iminoacetate synthase
MFPIDCAEARVTELLDRSSVNPDEPLRKAEAGLPLSLDELAVLITLSEQPERERVLAAAARRTRQVHGDAIGLIAPLYIDNHCHNSCTYCGMRRENKALVRGRIQSHDDFKEEVRILSQLGYRTVELVAGGIPLNMDTIGEYIETMERFQIENVAFFFDTLDAAQYRVLAEAHGDVTMIHWQETYCRTDYALYHPPQTPKGNFERRLSAIESAVRSGLRKYAIGVLFGLAEPRRDVLLCIAHGRYLSDAFGVPPAALGLVRLQPSDGAEVVDMPHPVDERLHLFFAAVLRLAFPEADMIATSREAPSQIAALLRVAATFTNATCTTVPGGYSGKVAAGLQRNGQFYHGSPTFASVKRLVQKAGLQLNPSRPLGRG